MTYKKRKFYVVWEGRAPGIYDTWEECRRQVDNFPGAKFRSYDNQTDATEAFRGDPGEQLTLMRKFAEYRSSIRVPADYSSIPEIRLDAIAVDGACAHNPGPMEYRAVHVGSGKEIFHAGPFEGGTNNIAEYLAIIHCAALLHRNADFTTPIYSDSLTARSWVRQRRSKTTVVPSEDNARVCDLLRRADIWIAANDIINPVLKWETERWGEIPADFGRK